MKLWLDDIRDPIHFVGVGWTWAKTAQEAINFLKTGDVVIVSLDHDLTEEQMTGGILGEIRDDGHKSGYDVAVWLEEHPHFRPNIIRVHSANPAGAARMRQVINRFS